MASPVTSAIPYSISMGNHELCAPGASSACKLAMCNRPFAARSIMSTNCRRARDALPFAGVSYSFWNGTDSGGECGVATLALLPFPPPANYATLSASGDVPASAPRARVLNDGVKGSPPSGLR